MNALEHRIPPPAIGLVLGMAMWAMARTVSTGEFRFPGQNLVAGAVLLIGMLFDILGLLRFRASRTTVNPLHPERSTSLVASGVYRFTRNPMYLGFLLNLLAWGVYLGSLPALLLVPLFVLYMNRFQIGPEERALEMKFGDEYRAYRSRVRRWI